MITGAAIIEATLVYELCPSKKQKLQLQRTFESQKKRLMRSQRIVSAAHLTCSNSTVQTAQHLNESNFSAFIFVRRTYVWLCGNKA